VELKRAGRILDAAKLRWTIADYQEDYEDALHELGLEELPQALVDEAQAALSVEHIVNPLDGEAEPFSGFNENLGRLFWECLRRNAEYISDFAARQGQETHAKVMYFRERYQIPMPIDPESDLADIQVVLMEEALMESTRLKISFLRSEPIDQIMENVSRLKKQPGIKRRTIDFPVYHRSVEAWSLRRQGFKLVDVAENMGYVPTRTPEDHFTVDNQIELLKKDLKRANELIALSSQGLVAFSQGI